MTQPPTEAGAASEQPAPVPTAGVSRSFRSSRTRDRQARPKQRAQSVQNRNRGHDHRVRGVDVYVYNPHRLVQLLDRIRLERLPVRPADDDRLARSDLPLDIR